MNDKNKIKYNESNSGRICRDIFITSFIAASTGFFLGLLFAPQSGKKFRGILLDKIKVALDRSKFAFIEARVKAEEFLEKSIQDPQDK